MRLGTVWTYARLELADRRAGRQLRPAFDRTTRIGARDIVLVACLRNEKFRMPAFVDHYRRLGVDHFLFVDNDSTDGFLDWARDEPDVSVWRTGASYREAAFGMLWCNDLLRRHGTGRWCVTVDPDEFLVFPFMETRGLPALTRFLDEERRPCMHALLIDAYAEGPVSETTLAEGDDPFAVCPFFDGDGYVQARGWGGGLWVRGGPRLRVHFADRPMHAPALNKIPLVRWGRDSHYRMSTHDARPLYLNRAHAPGAVSVTGALFHFKFVASLADKAREEQVRREHYASGREYDRYAAAAADRLHLPGVSLRYEGPGQLLALGLMSAGRWY
jgi:hypothetical protein